MSRDKRIELHQKGKALMKESRWREAIAVFQEARRDHGDNLLLLVDLAACEYMDGSIFSLDHTIAEIESALAIHRPILSPNTYYNAVLFLGKFLEEKGQFKNALANYEQIVTGTAFDDRQKVMALSQIVRANCFLGLNRQAESAFLDLSTRLRAFKTENLKVEVLHALMLGDLAIVGAEAAIARYVRSKDEPYVMSDLPLLYFDLLDGLFASGFATAEALREFHDDSIEATNGFELTLAKLARGEAVLYREAFARAEEMTLTTQLRLAVLVHAHGNSGVDQARALSLISTLLRSFDPFSAKALTTRFRLSLSEQDYEEIVLNQKTIEVRGQTIDWARRTTARLLLEVLKDGQAMDVEDVVRRVWNSDYNESYSDRLRILVRRINTDLQAASMKPEIIVMTGGRLILAQGIRIRLA